MKKPGKKFLIYVLLGVLILIFIYFGYAYGKKAWPFGAPGGQKWQVIQLINGDIYYGKLKTFPGLKLTNVYFVQQVPAQEEGGQPGTQLVPLNSLFFGPENIMRLNKEQILWWADLTENSQILQAIRGQ